MDYHAFMRIAQKYSIFVAADIAAANAVPIRCCLAWVKFLKKEVGHCAA